MRSILPPVHEPAGGWYRRATGGVAFYDGMVRVRDLASGQELATVGLEGARSTVAVASDGVTIVTGDQAGNVWCLRQVEPAGPEGG